MIRPRTLGRFRAMEFTTALVRMKDRSGRLGLWKTMHAIDEATKVAGWEIADLLAKRNPKGR